MDIIIRHFKYAEPGQADPLHQRAVAFSTDGCSLHRTGGFVAESGASQAAHAWAAKHGHSVVREIGLIQMRSASASSYPELTGWMTLWNS